MGQQECGDVHVGVVVARWEALPLKRLPIGGMLEWVHTVRREEERVGPGGEARCGDLLTMSISSGITTQFTSTNSINSVNSANSMNSANSVNAISKAHAKYRVIGF